MAAEQTKIYRLDDRIAKVAIILMAIGAVFVFSAGTDLGNKLDLSRFYAYPGLRQILFFPLACLVMFAVSCINHKHLSFAQGVHKSLTPYLLVASFLLLFLVLLPQFGTTRGGAQRWIRIPAGSTDISFQPSEIAKWTMIFFLAAICAKNEFAIKSFWKQFLPICALVSLCVYMIIIEDFGTAAFIALISFCMLLIGGAKWWHLLSPLPFAAAGFYLMLLQAPHRIDRIKAFLNPEKYAGDVAYQAQQSLVALGSGGLWGKGIGKGICKYGYLPEDTTDFVFAIIGEELGLIGCAAVILLFVCFIWLGLLVIIRSKDGFSQLLATGIVLAISIQAALNIGVVTVVLPTKGIPLPFLSGGGTSLLVSAAAVGVLLNIAKQANGDKEETEDV
jgi:cell division protein FtsW